MTESIYIGEAATARTLDEHKVRARQTWDRIAAIWRDGDSVTGKPITEEQRDALRAAAVKGFWLYPLVEAVLRVPGGAGRPGMTHIDANHHNDPVAGRYVR